jgi:hypothetical protein
VNFGPAYLHLRLRRNGRRGINTKEEPQYLHYDQADGFSDTPRHARPGVALAEKLRWIAVAFGVIGLLLAGCGGASSGLSRSPLDAQADSICQQGTAEIKAAGPLPTDFETSSVAAAGYLDRIVPISDKTISELSALKPNGSVKEEMEPVHHDYSSRRS